MVKYFHWIRTSNLLTAAGSLAAVFGLVAMDRQWFIAKMCAAVAAVGLVIAGLIIGAIEKERDRSLGR
jgi:hypothetical protein